MSAVFITGGAGELGSSFAKRFSESGYAVAIGDIDEEAGERLVKKLGNTTPACFVRLDVRSKASIEEARERATRAIGPPHVLINNAAVMAASPTLDITSDEFDLVLGVTLKGTFLGCQVFGQHFKAGRGGRIINVASLAGQNGGSATGAHYAAAKGGVLALTKVFARDLAPFGVTVNAISPGPLDLSSTRAVVGESKIEDVKSAVPMGVLGEAAFIADIALLLASDRATFATGSTIDANGGLFMR
jgi:3-oxoacyl-[acyl-carrier protein] reductase